MISPSRLRLRARRGVTFCVAAAVAAGALSFTAAPAGAFVGGPGTGVAPVTDAPDLISANVLADSEIFNQLRVRYCFDEALNGPGTANRFYASTYDAGRILKGSSVTFDPTSGAKCVVVSFNPNVDLETQGSLAMVEREAVQNTGSRPNYDSSAPLQGSSLSQIPGRTTGPDLVAVAPDPASNSVTYTFDQPIDDNPDYVDGRRFGMVDDGGVEVNGLDDPANQPFVSADSLRVRVSFPTGELVSNKIRFFNRARAVRTPPQDEFTSDTAPARNCLLASTAECLATPAPDGVEATGDSTRPVLTNAERSGNQFTLTYSKSSGPFTATSVVAVLDNGNVEPATSSNFVSGSDSRQVIISFSPTGAVAKEPTAVVKIISQTGAAKDQNTSAAAPISATNVGAGAPMRPGYTNGPDLLTTNLNPATSQAQFNYDEAIDPARVLNIPEYKLLVANGTPKNGSNLAEAAGNHITISYGNDFTAAVGVANYRGTTSDPLGNPALYGSVSIDNVPPPPPPTAANDAVGIARGASSTVSVLANDTTTGGTTVSLGTVPPGITATVQPDDTVTVSVASDYVGSATVNIPYQVTDDNGTAGAAIVVTVTQAPRFASRTTIAAKAKVTKGTKVKITVTVKRGAANATGRVVIKIGMRTVRTALLAGRAMVSVKITKKTKVTASYQGNTTTLPSSARKTIRLR